MIAKVFGKFKNHNNAVHKLEHYTEEITELTQSAQTLIIWIQSD